MLRQILIPCIALAFLVPEFALAQSKPGQTQADINARADDLFRKGRDEQDRGNCNKALELFRESHALKPGRGTLLNMGLCEKKLGQLAKALMHFEELLPQLPSGDDRRQIVRDALAEIKPKVPYLRIVLRADAPAGTIVTYDKAEIAPTMIGTDMPVDPGKHVIVVDAPGLPNRNYDIVMEEGKKQTLQVEPGAKTDGSSDSKSAASASNPQRTVGFVLGGVGIASLLTGAITGVMAVSANQELDKSCPSRSGCSADALATAERGKSLSIANTVTLAVGVVAVGISIPLLLTSKKAKEPAAAKIWISPDGARLGLTGSF